MPPSDSPRPSTSVSRRAVLATSAWAAPAVVVASQTPAFAGSGTPRVAVSYLLSWAAAGLTHTGTVTPGWPFSPYEAYTAVARPVDSSLGAPDITVRLTSTFTRMRALADNMTVSSHHVGGLGHPGLTLAQRLPAHYSGAYTEADSLAQQTVDISFGGFDVTDLRLRVTTLDTRNEYYSDKLELGVGGEFLAPPWYPQSPGHTAYKSNDANYTATPSKGVLDPVTSKEGTMDVTKSSRAHKSISLTYFNTSNGYSHKLSGYDYVRAVRDGGEQRVYVADMTLTALVPLDD